MNSRRGEPADLEVEGLIFDIALDNTVGRLIAPQPVIRKIRELVAFAPVRLPPPPAQAAIKAFFREHGRRGGDEDLYLVWHHIGDTLRKAGVVPETLTREALEQVLRQRGCWSGWIPLMDVEGRFSAGLIEQVQRALWRTGHSSSIKDVRTPVPPGPAIGRPPPLWDFQEDAVQAMLREKRGVIDLPPRSGKTRIAAALIQRLGLPTIYITPRRELVRQTAASLREWLPENAVFPIDGGASSMSAKKKRAMRASLVWVMPPGTAAGPKSGGYGGIEGLSSRKVMFIDEFHHAAADIYLSVSRAAVNCYWRFGLTGTHFRADGRDLVMHGVLAKSIFRREVGEMIAKGVLAPAKVAMLRIPGWAVSGREAYAQGIVRHKGRNDALASAARLLASTGRRVLVLTKEVAHAKHLASLIPNSWQVDGQTSTEVRSALDALEARKISAVVGTSVIGEGVDVPAADALVYAAGGRSRVKVVQDFFRVLTASPGKREGIIVDGADGHSETLVRQAAQRLAIYRSVDAFRADVVDPSHLGSWLHGVTNDP